MPTPETTDNQFTYRSRRQRAEQRQRDRRRRELHARLRATDFHRRQDTSCRRTASRLGLAPRTLCEWKLREDRRQLQPRSLGRPCKESPAAAKREAIRLLEREGPHLGLPTLRAALPKLPRCEWIDLQRDYRAWYRQQRTGRQQLHWRKPGSVWAVDHSQSPVLVDGVYQDILAVRDLASGMQLAWLPVPDQTANTAVAALQVLFAEHGPPLLLKSDNGSAFKSELWSQLLDRWQVVPLFSPAGTPRYNGSCEAGIGAMKTRTLFLAAASDRLQSWTSDDFQAALRQANELHRNEQDPRRSAQQRWRERVKLTDEDRERFTFALDEQRQKLHNEVREAGDNQREVARVERKIVTQTLVELGLLTVTWRSIPLPLNHKKLANFS